MCFDRIDRIEKEKRKERKDKEKIGDRQATTAKASTSVATNRLLLLLLL